MNRMIVRSIPINAFNQVINRLHAIAPWCHDDVLIQQDIIDTLDARIPLRPVTIKPGRLDFFKGLDLVSFNTYAEIILPLSSRELRPNFNLILFVFPLFPGKYTLHYPDGSLVSFTRIQFFLLVARIISYYILIVLFVLFACPVVKIVELYFSAKRWMHGFTRK